MTPDALGLSMPAEWSPHAGCWMAWPRRKELWGSYLEAAREDYIRVAQTIARHEPLTMVADPSEEANARRRCGTGIRVIALPLDDSWLRDAAPTFLTDGKGGRAATAFTFNAWGNKFEVFDLDAELGVRIAEHAKVPAYRSSLVAEGGGFLSDGEGTLITAETCILNPNRNPGWSKADAEKELLSMLGMKKVIWLPGDVTETGTDGHVDGYIAYVKPATVLCEVVADPSDPRFAIMAENRRVLQLETDARGRHFELLPIGEAPRSRAPGGDPGYCRSYVNFYLANGAVIAPSYGIPEDAEVRDTLHRAYPDRQVDMISLNDLFRGGGGIHCITQQEPAA